MSTTKDIVPVRAIDDCAFHVGDNTVTMTLKREFAKHVANYVATHQTALWVPES